MLRFSNKIGGFPELIIIVVIFIVICFIYKGQQRVSLNDGKGWDGIHYQNMAEQIKNDVFPLVEELPFVKRIGTPFLTGTLSKITGINLLDSVFIVNLIGMFITVILLTFWLRQFVGVPWIRLTLLTFFMVAWHGPIRMVFYSPEGTDKWGAVWFVGGLLVLNYIQKSYIIRKRFRIKDFLILSLVIAIGYTFRESNAVLAIVPFFFLNPLKNLKVALKTATLSHVWKIIKQIWNLYNSKQTVFLFLPIIAVILTMIGVSYLIKVDSQNQYTFILSACKYFYSKSLPEYLLGIFIAYGPLLTLLPFYWKEFRSFFYERQDLLILLIISFFFGYVGGSGTERITFMSSFPIMLIITGISIKNIYYSNQRWWLYVLIILQTIAYRFYWTVPDCPNDIDRIPVPFLTLIGNQFNPYYLYSGYGNYYLNTVLFIEYVVLFIVTFYVLHHQIAFKLPGHNKKDQSH